jgi:hypothetical protein
MSLNTLPNGFRPAFISGITTIRVETTGNDATANGSALFPFLTLNAAIAAAPWNQTTTVQLGAGSFAAPYISPGSISIFANATNLVIRGTATAGTIATIANVVSTVITSEMVLDVTGLAVAADALRAERFVFGAGPATGRVFWCVRNDATGAINPGETRLYGIQVTSSTINVPAVGNTLTQQSLTELTGASLNSNSTVNFQDVAINLTGPITALNGRFSTFNCRIRCSRIQTQQPDDSGAVSLRTSYYQPSSTTLPAGFFPVGAVRTSGGNVIDLGNANVGLRSLLFEGSKFYTSNQVLFRDVEEIQLNGSQVLGADLSAIGTYTANDPWVFESQGAVSCTDGVVINTQPAGFQGNYSLPPMYGQITGDYIVTAQKDADVFSTIVGSVTTALGTNTVSADGGASLRSVSNDGTTILGMNPARVRAFGAFDVASASGPAIVNMQPWSMLTGDPTGGALDIKLPQTPQTGDEVCIVNPTTVVLNTITIDAAPNSLASTAVPGTFVASEVFAVAGLSRHYRFNGAFWLLV